MTIQEQNYADYLFNLADPNMVAQSYANVQTNNITCIEEQEYFDYLIPLTGQDVGDADYNVFSDLYDRINVAIHGAYYIAFENVDYSLAICKKRKEPAK